MVVVDYKNQIEFVKSIIQHPPRRTPFNNTEKLKLAIGNTKIGYDTIIVNMGTAHNCPSAKLGLCNLAHKKYGGDGSCYALKAEYLYPPSITFRAIQKIQFELWNSLKIADEIFEEVKKHPKTKIKYVRFNESGDFHSISQVIKAGEVARYVKEFCLMAGIPVIKFYTYTHRSDIFSGESGKELLKKMPDNFTINGSNFMVHNNFKVMDISKKERDSKEFGKFTCKDDCRKCSLCKVRSKNGIEIIQAKH